MASSLDPRATLTMSAIYNPGNLDKVITAIREELAKLLDTGVTQKELDDARRGFLQSQEVMRTDDSRLAQLLESTLLADRTMEHYLIMERRIEELTPETVLAALKKHIHPEKMLTVVAGDWDAVKSDSK